MVEVVEGEEGGCIECLDVMFFFLPGQKSNTEGIPYASLSSFHLPPGHSEECIQAVAECRQMIRGPFRASPLNEGVESVEGGESRFHTKFQFQLTIYFVEVRTRQQTSRNDGINRPPRTTNTVPPHDTRRQTRHRPPHSPLPIPRKNNPNLLVPPQTSPLVS